MKFDAFNKTTDCLTHHFSQGSNNIKVVIESSKVKWHVAIVLLDIYDVLLLLDKVLYGTTNKDLHDSIYNILSTFFVD